MMLSKKIATLKRVPEGPLGPCKKMLICQDDMSQCKYDKAFKTACKTGQVDVVNAYLASAAEEEGGRRITRVVFQKAFVNACSSGDMRIIECLYASRMGISAHAYADGFEYACRFGRYNVIKFFMDRELVGYVDDLRYGEAFARLCESGFGRCMPLFFRDDVGGKLGDEHIRTAIRRMYANCGCNLAELLLLGPRGSAFCAADFDRLVLDSSLSQIKRLLSFHGLHKMSHAALGRTIEKAAKDGDVELVELILSDASLVALLPNSSYKRVFLQMCSQNRPHVIEKLVTGDNINKISDHAFGRALEDACSRGHLEVIPFLCNGEKLSSRTLRNVYDLHPSASVMHVLLTFISYPLFSECLLLD